jgi:hypothetical protein
MRSTIRLLDSLCQMPAPPNSPPLGESDRSVNGFRSWRATRVNVDPVPNAATWRRLAARDRHLRSADGDCFAPARYSRPETLTPDRERTISRHISGEVVRPDGADRQRITRSPTVDAWRVADAIIGCTIWAAMWRAVWCSARIAARVLCAASAHRRCERLAEPERFVGQAAREGHHGSGRGCRARPPPVDLTVSDAAEFGWTGQIGSARVEARRREACHG